MLEAFLNDKKAWDMYVTGAAGTGKTTSMREDVQYLMDNEIPYVVCAFTHKACGILRSKLPQGAEVQTLHKFLKKRPCINQNATKQEHVNTTSKQGDSDEYPEIMLLDEYSMVGEKDGLDIREAQDRDYTGIPTLKVAWYGDNHQLPPVGDVMYVKPNGKYQKLLTKQWRNDNPLQKPLNSLISFLDGATPHSLESVEDYFIRDKDIVTEYTESSERDKILLAYTNRRVQELNFDIEGTDTPRPGDVVFSPTTNHLYKFIKFVHDPVEIACHYDDPLQLDSKYRTLENLIESELCEFALLEDEDGEQMVWAMVFGHYNYKTQKESLEHDAVESNKAVEAHKPGFKAAAWSKVNYKHPLARARSKAWRDCLSFKDYVICIDFTHATTVHKSQGSTFKEVYLDTDDLAICAQLDFTMYLKLTYVGISRASHKVITS